MIRLGLQATSHLAFEHGHPFARVAGFAFSSLIEKNLLSYNGSSILVIGINVNDVADE